MHNPPAGADLHRRHREGVIPRFSDLGVFLQLLPRSATGERMNPYTSIWTGTTANDGPEEVHIVLLDGGRTNALADPVGRDALACIRCGACLNICPVYSRAGGHAYGSVYAGPIGAILAPQIDGLDKHASLPYASTLCGACYEVCPVKINIPEILLHLRGQVRHGLRERLAMRIAAWTLGGRRRMRVAQNARQAVCPLCPAARVDTKPRYAATTKAELQHMGGEDVERPRCSPRKDPETSEQTVWSCLRCLPSDRLAHTRSANGPLLRSGRGISRLGCLHATWRNPRCDCHSDPRDAGRDRPGVPPRIVARAAGHRPRAVIRGAGLCSWGTDDLHTRNSGYGDDPAEWGSPRRPSSHDALIPDTHVCIVDSDQIVETVPDAQLGRLATQLSTTALPHAHLEAPRRPRILRCGGSRVCTDRASS